MAEKTCVCFPYTEPHGEQGLEPNPDCPKHFPKSGTPADPGVPDGAGETVPPQAADPAPSPQTDDGAPESPQVAATPPRSHAPPSPPFLFTAPENLSAEEAEALKARFRESVRTERPQWIWDDRPAMDPEDATHCLRAIHNDPDPQRRAFALGALSTTLATCAVFPGARSDRMLAETLRTLRDRVPWGDSEDHR